MRESLPNTRDDKDVLNLIILSVGLSYGHGRGNDCSGLE